MKIRIVMLWVGLLAAGPGMADTYRFDMGTEESPVAPGCTRVTPKHTLKESPHFGWAAAPRMTVLRNDPANPYFADAGTSTEYALYSDGHLSLGENTFTFRVKPGRYAVTAALGDLALDETRPGNSVWANGAQVVKGASTTASVKAFRFPVDAPDGRIALRFTAESVQRYSTVMAVTAEPLGPGEACKPSMAEFPPGPVPPETYRRNWERFQDLLLADWEQAKKELAAEGVDLAYWEKVAARLRGRPGYREYFAWGLGSWERLEARAGTLSMGRMAGTFREMGIDGFIADSQVAIRELPQHGFLRAAHGGGEGFPRPDMTGVTLNLMRSPDGSTGTIPGVWSNCAPEVVEAFREYWGRALAHGEGTAFFVIDEPRGMWYSGRMGDYSPPAMEAFRKWAAEQGWAELSRKGIPERSRSLDFYRFYQFRLDSVPRFVESVLKGIPGERGPAMPGNGNVGPEQMNHSGYWPPAMAKRGMVAACWAYDSPASCKMYAETLRFAGEHGGESTIVPPLWPEMHTPVQDLPMNTACISALTTRVAPWRFSGPLNGPNRTAWMKTVYLGARLTHATSGLTHTPPLYVWCPESIVYNDLVEMNTDEAQHWRKVWQALFDANLDYGVTNTLAIPKDAVLLYACVRPVLTVEEFGRLEGFVRGGGSVLCAFEGTPELPDGTPIAGWAVLPRERVHRLELAPEALKAQAEALSRHRNWQTGAPAVKTYLYRQGDTPVHLLNNTDIASPATTVLPVRMRDLLTGRDLAAGAGLRLHPGGHALLAALP